MISIDLDTLQWEEVPYKIGPKLLIDKFCTSQVESSPENRFASHCYGHKCVLVAYDRETLSLRKQSSPNYGNEKRMLLYEGVYLFGGVRGSTSEDSHVSSCVYLMKVGDPSCSPVTWQEVETKGCPPEGRFHHGFDYYKKGNYLVVYGGRRFVKLKTRAQGGGNKARMDKFVEANRLQLTSSDSEFVRQVAVLKLDTLEWHEVVFRGQGEHCPDLYNFSASLWGDEILLFGGMSNRYF